MRTAIYGALVVLMAVGLAACGGAPNQAPENSMDTSTRQISTPGGFEFLHYAVKLTGAANAQAEGAAQVIIQGDAQRFVSLAGPDIGFQVVLQLPTVVQPGISALFAASGDYRAQISTSADEGGQYTANASGTLEITSSDPLQGRFSYTAANAGGEIITAEGSFYEVIYTFNANITGTVDTTIPPGQVSAVVFGDDYALTLQTPDSSGSVFSITFYLPHAVTAGMYGLVADTAQAQEGQIGVIINNNGETSVSYDQGIAGTLTLSEVGQQFTGTFKVIAASSDGKNVIVEGNFEEIPLLTSQAS